MKKALIIIVSLVGMVMMAHAQQSDTLIFMNDYRKFINYVDSQTVLTKSVADSIIARQDTLMFEYRRLKPQLNNAQVGEFYRLKAHYTKRC